MLSIVTAYLVCLVVVVLLLKGSSSPHTVETDAEQLAWLKYVSDKRDERLGQQ